MEITHLKFNFKYYNKILKDRLNSITMNIFDQIENAHKQIILDPKLKYGYHGIGLSQGGLFL